CRRVDVDVCASTNDVAAQLAREGAAHGTVVVAQEQTAGRGRMGRRWHSPRGDSLYLSLVVRPDILPRQVPPITLAAGLAVIDAVNSAGVAASLKWPNDVLVGERKLAGILTEMSTRGERVDHVIVGIGVNLAARAFPPELAGGATSIALAGGDVDPAAFERALLAGLERWLDRFLVGGPPAIADAWTAAARLGPVRVDDGERALVAEAVGLDGDGALIVVDTDGHRHRITAGDVVLRGQRP
ncbi:MAG TPA: biotin--[acetyl-CoA-carboxylase] ligase, partial [Kofleriaceae bacterium]|nr:biotin--[acetyl-CoA-carboxylase] ligase [Kofleriaceae bacterium]